MTRFAPQWLQAGSYAASVDRRLIGALWPSPAVSGCAVTVSSGMVVNVAAGSVAVPSGNNTGSVLCSSDATEQVTLAAAPASGSNRYDLVVCQARGNDLDGGANNDFLFTNVTGTAAATPSVPAVPANAVSLAQIYVPGGSASVTAGNITDQRSFLTAVDARAVLGYAELAANAGPQGAEAVFLTAPAVTVTANRRIRIDAFAPRITGSNAGTLITLSIKEGATFIQQWFTVTDPSLAAGGGYWGRTITPTPGSHTYTLTLACSGGTVTLGGSATFVNWIRITDDGPV